MTLSPYTECSNWHHARFMARLPSLEPAPFDTSPFENTIFEVWPQEDAERAGEPFLRVMPIATHLYHGVSALLREHQASFAALLTAWNPGRLETDAFNQDANRRLLDALHASGLPVYPARGTSTSGDWFEDSFVVVGGSYDQYVAWQEDFEQLAFVLFRTDGSVWLRW